MDSSIAVEYLPEGILFLIPAVIAIGIYVRLRRVMFAAETLADDLAVLLPMGDARRIESRLDEVGGTMAATMRKVMDAARQGVLPDEARTRVEIRGSLIPMEDGVLIAIAILGCGLLFLDLRPPASYTIPLALELPAVSGFLLLRSTADYAVRRVARAICLVATETERYRLPLPPATSLDGPRMAT